jgi:glutamate--cysteine ligase
MNFLKTLSQKILSNQPTLDNFFTEKFSQHPALFYNSVDLRYSGFKIAPIDTNCFPAGFGLLGEASWKKAKKTAAEFLSHNFPNAKNIIIIPENHTRNFRYLKNVVALQKIVGENVKIGSLITQETTKIDLENGEFITLEPIDKINNLIKIRNGEITDLIISNNDFTDGIPEILQNISTPIIPSPNLGWHRRTKSEHFTIYNQLASEVAKILDIDPWLISTLHRTCDDVNFKEQKGIECLAKQVDELIIEIKEKYQKYGINEEPYCFIKADNGTYGIAVWAVFSGNDVLEINKKERNKMNMLKGSVQTTKVLIQEGIKTIDKINNKIAEPMIYMIDGQIVGNLFRVNQNRDEKISLNSEGMEFFDLEILEKNQLNFTVEKEEIIAIYNFIARLAALAAAEENLTL